MSASPGAHRRTALRVAPLLVVAALLLAGTVTLERVRVTRSQGIRAALRATTHAFVMEQGRIVHHGASDELARDPDVIAHYLGQAGTKPAAAPAH